MFVFGRPESSNFLPYYSFVILFSDISGCYSIINRSKAQGNSLCLNCSQIDNFMSTSWTNFWFQPFFCQRSSQPQWDNKQQYPQLFYPFSKKTSTSHDFSFNFHFLANQGGYVVFNINHFQSTKMNVSAIKLK